MPAQVLQGTLILPDRLLNDGQIVVEEGIIQEVVEADRGYDSTLDFGDSFIAPGFIDLHVHGIAGVDTMDGSQESLSLMAERFAAHGVTGFLPTTMTASLEATTQAIGQVHAAMSEQKPHVPSRARILGAHLEGPWISPQFKGAQNESFVTLPEEASVRAILDAAEGALRIVTLAPEMPGADLAIRRLLQESVWISIGHSGATYEQALQAIDLGASHITHCFNAMTGLNHRNPGVAGAALMSGDVFAELIADGLHVHPDVMRLLIRVKGRERVMLITDSMSASERPDGRYDLGGQEVVVRGGEARLHDGTLAGSTLVMDQGLRNLIHLCRMPLVDAVYMASSTPAMAIGMGTTKGKIRTGYDADLTIMDAQLLPQAIMIDGNVFLIDAPG